MEKTVKKKKLLRIYKNPEKLKAPRTERQLPLAFNSNEIITFIDSNLYSHVILNNLLKNTVVELLGIGDNDKDNYAYFNSNSVYIKLLEEYQLNTKFKRICKSGNIHHHISNNCKNFSNWYKKLIFQFIGPHIVRKFIDEDEEENDVSIEKEFTVLYQFPPTIRVYNSHLIDTKNKDIKNNHEITYKNLGKMHCDSVFGHQIGEVNFWMPLTPTHPTSTLYAETSPGKADWYSFHPLHPGSIMRFPGTFCRHKTKPNISGKTRVSIDFRCSMSTCFDKDYQGRRITSRRHQMLEAVYKTTAANASSKREVHFLSGA